FRSIVFSCHSSDGALFYFPTRRSSDLLHGDWARFDEVHFHKRQIFALQTPRFLEIIFPAGANEFRHLRGNFIGSHRNNALPAKRDRKSTRLNSSHVKISYAVFCLKKKK